MKRRKTVRVALSVVLVPVLLWLVWMAYWGRLGAAAAEVVDARFLSYYGQVVDENGLPQAGVEVRYYIQRCQPLRWLVPGMEGHDDEITTVTDAAGRFEVRNQYGLKGWPYAFRKGDRCWFAGTGESAAIGCKSIGTSRMIGTPLPTQAAPYRIVIRLDRGQPVEKHTYRYPDALRSGKTSKQMEVARYPLPATTPVPAVPDIWAELLDGRPATRPVAEPQLGTERERK